MAARYLNHFKMSRNESVPTPAFHSDGLVENTSCLGGPEEHGVAGEGLRGISPVRLNGCLGDTVS